MVRHFFSPNHYIERYKKLVSRMLQLSSENKILREVINNELLSSQALLNAISDTTLLLNKEGVYLDIFSEMENILVKPFNELVGKNIRNVLPGDLANKCIECIVQAIEQKQITHLQYNLEINDEMKYFDTRFSPIDDYKVICIIKDITDSVEKSKQIQEKEDWFKNIFNASRDGFAVEHNEKIINVNDAFVKLYGFDSQDELIGKSISVIQAAETDEMMKEYGLRRLRGEAVPTVYEAKGKCKNGEIIDIEVTASVFEVNGHKFIVDVNRNISERKNFERRLKTQNEELQKINQELDRFVYSASHDLRAPLRSLLGLVQLFRIDNDEGKKEQYLQRMEKSIHNLDHFIAEIISYSRNSRLELEAKPIDFKEILTVLIETLKFDSITNVDIQLDIKEEQKLLSDMGRLKVLFSNLISNAIRYHNPKAENPYVKVSVIVNKTEAIFIIEDNGIGIGKEHIDKVFNMFYRAHDKNVGTGLGLYIVKETVAKLNGQIDLQSELGKGTTFIIKIPNLLED